MVIDNALKPIDFCFEYVDSVEQRYNKMEYMMTYAVCKNVYDHDRQKLYGHCRGYAKNIEKGKNPELYNQKIKNEIEEFNKYLPNFMVKIGIRKDLLSDINREKFEIIKQKIVNDILTNIGIVEDTGSRDVLLEYLNKITLKLIEENKYDLNKEEERIHFLNHIISYTIDNFAHSMRFMSPKLILHDYEPIDHVLNVQETIEIFKSKMRKSNELRSVFFDTERQLKISNSVKDILQFVNNEINEFDSLKEPIIHLPGFENGITTATKREFVKVVLSNFGFGTAQCPYKKKPYSVIGQIKCDDPTYSSFLAFDSWYGRNRSKE